LQKQRSDTVESEEEVEGKGEDGSMKRCPEKEGQRGGGGAGGLCGLSSPPSPSVVCFVDRDNVIKA